MLIGMVVPVAVEEQVVQVMPEEEEPELLLQAVRHGRFPQLGIPLTMFKLSVRVVVVVMG
jgi:hypothetical protein